MAPELTETKRTNLKLHSEKKKAEQKANIEKQKNDLLQHEVAVLKKKQIPLENRISDLDRSFKQSEQTNLDNQGKLAMVEKKNKELTKERNMLGELLNYKGTFNSSNFGVYNETNLKLLYEKHIASKKK